MDQNLEEMYANFTNTWNTLIPTLGVVSYIPEIRYQGALYGDPDRSKYWCRLSTVTLRAEQATLSTNAGDEGKRRYKVRGLIFAQIFAPRQVVGAWEIAGSLAKVAQTAFRKYPSNSNVWMTNATIENLEPEENWIRWNVSASFTFDEFQ